MLQQLYGVVQRPGAREGDAHMATDNAVSAVGKLVEFQRAHVDAPALLGAWLGYLPMREDTEEACQVRVSAKELWSISARSRKGGACEACCGWPWLMCCQAARAL
jgi:hypothetical protein